MREFTVEDFQNPRHQKRELKASDYKFLRIPLGTWNAQLYGVQPATKPAIDNYVTNVVPLILEGRGLWLHGKVGTGKTCLAALLAKVALAHHFNAIYATPTDIRDSILHREVIRDDDTLADIILDVEFLALDDLHEADASAKFFGRDEIRSLLAKRCNECLTTVVTTRMTPLVLDQYFGDLLASTGYRMCSVVVDGINLKTADADEFREFLYKAPESKQPTPEK